MTFCFVSGSGRSSLDSLPIPIARTRKPQGRFFSIWPDPHGKDNVVRLSGADWMMATPSCHHHGNSVFGVATIGESPCLAKRLESSSRRHEWFGHWELPRLCWAWNLIEHEGLELGTDLAFRPRPFPPDVLPVWLTEPSS